MSSIHILNKATKTRPGGGLPFYDNVDHVFSYSNEEFNSIDGLLKWPNNKVPTFQLWLSYEFITSFTYLATLGNNVFVPVNDFTPAAFGGISIKGVRVDFNDGNGIVQRYIYQTQRTGSLVSPAPDGRWIAELVVNNGGGDVTFYSEEFVTKSCC